MNWYILILVGWSDIGEASLYKGQGKAFKSYEDAHNHWIKYYQKRGKWDYRIVSVKAPR